MSTYLVTGGAGFIGSHIAAKLASQNKRVRVFDNLSTGSRDNLAGLSKNVELIQGDIRDLGQLRGAFEEVEVVFHQAALASVVRSVEDPMATHETCATGTLNVLLAARDCSVRRVVYAASSSAYGGAGSLPTTEDQVPVTLSPYAAAKLAGENYCKCFTEVFGLETVRLRYFNVFGPRQDPASPYSAVIPLFIEAMRRGKAPTIYGDGEQSRDFTYIDNVVAANLLASEAPAAAGNVYNIANGSRASLLDIIAALNELLGTHIVPKHDEPRPGDVRHSQADVSRANKDLAYEPVVDLLEGLKRTLAYYQSTS